MANLKLQAKYRSDTSKSRKKAIRKEGYVTGSVFGHGVEPVSIELKLGDLAHQITKSEAGMMSLIDLEIDDGPKDSNGIIIIKEFYKDPLTRKVLDVQFQRVSMKEKLRVAVPIVLVGDAPGTKDGGTLEQILDALDIICLPNDIPSRYELDISNIGIGDQIRVSDIVLKEGIDVLTDADTTVCTCRPPHVVAEPEPEAAEAAPETAEAPAEGEAAAE
jgi:large subunit ribosomal protein L25